MDQTSHNQSETIRQGDDSANTSSDTALQPAENSSASVASTDMATKPAQKPTNDVSKKIGNKNALTHGLYSKDVVLPWESQNDFEMLFKDFREEWKPKGRSQMEAVWDLTTYTWTKRRIIKGSQLAFSGSTVPEELKSGETSWDDILEHLAMIPKQAAGANISVNKFISNLDGVFEMIRTAKDNAEGKDVQEHLQQMQYQVMTLIEKTKTELIPNVNALVEIMQESRNRFEQAYRPEEFDKQLDLVAKTDARIEKTLRRLTSLKVFQRVESEASLQTQSVLESPSTVPDESSPAS
jgi:hypothetical protein